MVHQEKPSHQSNERDGFSCFYAVKSVAYFKPEFSTSNCVYLWEEATLYGRLIGRGKTKMQAYVAVQPKLLILIWALA